MRKSCQRMVRLLVRHCEDKYSYYITNLIYKGPAML